MKLAQLLDRLEKMHGKPVPVTPSEPYQMLLYANCGYPPSDERCQAGFEALKRVIGVSPAGILEASDSELAKVMRAGGIVPELRAERLKTIARLTQNEYSGDLRSILHGSLADARKTLKRFPTIGDPGADKILLFSGIAAVVAVPSNALQVPLRLGYGKEAKSYSTSYRSAQLALAAELPPDTAVLQRAYLLLRRHGETLCKRSTPRCGECALSSTCPYFRKASALKGSRRKSRS